VQIEKAESQDIEFKKSWDDKYLHWVCAFANTQGGILYIGVDDKGNVVNLANSDMLKNDLKAESEASRKAAELIIRREQEKMRKAAAEKQVATTEATPTDNKVVMRQMLRDHYEQ
jgi:predicted HTH transcriptional regulator